MTERGIMLRETQIKGLKAGKRTHLCVNAYLSSRWRQKKNSSLGMPSPFASLVAGDVLWVQEETVVLRNERNPMDQKAFYKADLLTGRPALPGYSGNGRSKYSTVDVPAARMARDGSRFVLTLTDVRLCTAQELTWQDVKAEGSTLYPSDTVGQWWERHYGFLMPWADKPKIVGLTFTAEHRNIDGHSVAQEETRRSSIEAYFETLEKKDAAQNAEAKSDKA